jgi:hypothetical protein
MIRVSLPNGKNVLVKDAKDYEIPIKITGVSVQERTVDDGTRSSCEPVVPYEDRPKVKYLSVDYKSGVTGRSGYNSSINLPISKDAPKINTPATLRISIPDTEKVKSASIRLPNGKSIKVAPL